MASSTMLKARDGLRQRAHQGGRVWWKWKIDPMSVDCVLVYAQAGTWTTG